MTAAYHEGVAQTPAPDDPAVLVGHVIAERYRVDGVLGRGGMGAVLRCHHLGLRRDVAVKLLHPELANDREIAARFEREAASASRLDHPNCVRVLDFGVWQPVPGMPAAKYLAMQLLEGEELAARLGAPIPVAQAVAWMQQIVAALEHAHDNGVVHRDLKPENVFITRDHDGVEQLKLVDFGIAKISEGEEAGPKLTRLGVVFGTPLYMSPEQATGGVVDARTDLYAAGVMLYELLSGAPPFTADDATSLLRKHLFEDPPSLPRSIPAPLRAVVQKLLEKERHDRYATATQVRAALDEVAAHLRELGNAATTMPAELSRGTLVLPSTMVLSPTPTALRAPTKQRWWMLAAALGIASLVGIAALRRAVPEPTRPPTVAASGWWMPAATPRAEARPDTAEVAAPPVFVPLPIVAAPPTEPGEDAAVLARRAHLLVEIAGKDVEALAAYGEAIDHDPKLLDDPTALAEVLALVRRPALYEVAVDFAIESLGVRGVPLLVELVQTPTPVLDYAQRHRALVRIALHPDDLARVDVGLQQALDLWQAPQTEVPCATFGATLDAIAEQPTATVLGTLHRVTPPVAPAGADAATLAVCALLPVRLQQVRAQVLAAHPVPAAEWTVPAAYAAAAKKKPAKKRGVFRRLFR